MNWKYNLTLGALVALAGIAGCYADVGAAPLVAAMGGALFGKGYGFAEARGIL
jgi:hypothetical protein